MLLVKDLFDKTWDELCKDKRFREVVEKGLGDEGVWEHVRSCCVVPITCEICGKTWSSYPDWMTDKNGTPCPIPPPITDPVEVVAERLRDKLNQENSCFVPKLFAQACRIADDIDMPVGEMSMESAMWWFGFFATPIQRIAVCLLTLELIGK